MYVNVWVAITLNGRNAIVERLNWDEEVDGVYSGPVTDIEYKIFSRMSDFAVVQRLFKVPNFALNDWVLFSLYFEAAPRAKEALDWLVENRAGQFYVLGAWDVRTGEQVKTSGEDPVAVYPIPAQLINFMPDIVEYDENGNVIGTTAPTQLTDVNLLQGQAPRNFTS